MRTRTASIVLFLGVIAAIHAAAAQTGPGDRQEIRVRLTQRYDIVALSNGVALRPRSPIPDVRLIEIADGTILVNGAAVSGGELRERLGADADAILRLSYMTRNELSALAAESGGAAARAPADANTPGQTPSAQPADEPVERAAPAPPPPPSTRDSGNDASPRRRSNGDRVRIFGNVRVAEDETVTGQVVAVLGSVRIDGEAGDQVVAVMGSVDLGPHAVVRGDVVSVGGRVNRAPGARTYGGVTEVALSDPDIHIPGGPWGREWTPFLPFANFGAVPRLMGSGFRLVLLLLLAGIALLLARQTVEASAHRVTDSPLRVTLVGLIAEILVLPALVLTAIVMAISIIGIPLLLLIPIVVLILILMALVGFTGTAAAVGQWFQRRMSLGPSTSFVSVCVGILVILSPLLLGRVLALAGWPATPFAALLIGVGFVVELLAWASGFGAVITNAFNRWQAGRPPRSQPLAPPAVP
jgi:hypothetical protein